jgi:hypothetical protein
MRLFVAAAISILLFASAAQARSPEPAPTCESLSALQSDFLTKEQAYQLGQQYAECLKRREENTKWFDRGVASVTPPTFWERTFKPWLAPSSPHVPTTTEISDEMRARGFKGHWGSDGSWIAEDGRQDDARRMLEAIGDRNRYVYCQEAGACSRAVQEDADRRYRKSFPLLMQ